MVHCFVPQCNHRSENKSCSMFTFPKLSPERKKWLRLIRRADTGPTKNIRVCSCHFKDGHKLNGPSIFHWNKRKIELHPETPEKVDKREVQLRQASEDLSPVLDHIKKEVEPLGGDDISCFPDLPSFENDTPSVQESNHDSCVNKIEDLTKDNELLRAEIQRLRKQLLHSSSVVVEAENTLLRGDVERLSKELAEKKDVFHFDMICHDDALVSHYTGLPNKETFLTVLKLFDSVEISYHKGWKVKRIDRLNQLFLTLMKLRRGFSNLDLGVRFGVGPSTISNVFLSWVFALHHVLVKTMMATVPSRLKNQIDLPKCFKDYPNTRFILDCTEVPTACPTLLRQSKMHSSYKSKMTSKGLVAVAPNGTVTFASKMYPGNTSDKAIVMESQILKCLVPGDSFMAHKGFAIDDLIPEGVTRNTPPFKHVPQVALEEIDKNSNAARVGAHAERAIARIKLYAILNYIPQFVVPYVSEIFQVCAALTNFRKPLMNDQADHDDE